MKLFSESGAAVQVLLLFSLLILFVLELYLQSLCHNHREKKRFIVNTVPLLATILLTLVLMWRRNSVEVCRFSLPFVIVLLTVILLFAYTVAEIVRHKRSCGDELTEDSVKDACDHIPFGLCFFAQNELPVLCNRQMAEIADELIGKNMQSLGELERALEHPAQGVTVLTVDGRRNYRLGDGREWCFDKTEVADREGNRYIQVTAADHTELNALNAELKARNKELKKMMRRLDRIRANIADSIREQEILTAKMRLHNKMGGCMTAARQYYMQSILDASAEKNPARKTELLRIWSRTVADLEDEIGHADESDPLEELAHIAKNAGLEIALHGQLPSDHEVNSLFIMALRECMINAIHHAAATRLDLEMEYVGGSVTGVYTNNGKAPEREIAEGGGLTGLRSRIEKEGGIVVVRSLTTFALTVTLPEELKSEDDDDECTDS